MGFKWLDCIHRLRGLLVVFGRCGFVGYGVGLLVIPFVVMRFALLGWV